MRILAACEESQAVTIVGREYGHEIYSCKHEAKHKGMFTTDRAKNRSKTFPGIARAMIEQWAGEA